MELPLILLLIMVLVVVELLDVWVVWLYGVFLCQRNHVCVVVEILWLYVVVLVVVLIMVVLLVIVITFNEFFQSIKTVYVVAKCRCVVLIELMDLLGKFVVLFLHFILLFHECFLRFIRIFEETLELAQKFILVFL